MRGLSFIAHCGLAIIILSLLSMACDRDATKLRQQVIGTWTKGTNSGGITFDSNGVFNSRWVRDSTNGQVERIYSGTWKLETNTIVITLTNSIVHNATTVESVGSVDRLRIIQVDSNQITVEGGGMTNSYDRKK